MENDGAPNYINQTIFQRALFSFESALVDEMKYYSSEEVVSDFSKQSKNLFVSTNLFYFVSLFLAYFLINSVDSATVNISTPLFQIEELVLTSEIFMLTLSVLYIWFLQRFFSAILLQTALTRIIEKSGFITPAYVVARHLPNNLWTELIRYHAFGYASGVVHHALIWIIFLFMAFALIAQIGFINFSAYVGLSELIGRSIFSTFISILSFSSIVFSTLFAALAVTIRLKFQFRDFEESDPMNAPEQ